MACYAVATNASKVFPAFGEMLWTAKVELAGKTTGMNVTAALCANPVNAKGTIPGLQSELLAASNEPEKPAPVLYYDEIGGLYGDAGMDPAPATGCLMTCFATATRTAPPASAATTEPRRCTQSTSRC